MKSKTTIRSLGAAFAFGAMLLPLSSQADLYWSLNLGHGLQSHHGYHAPRYDHRRAKHHGHKQHHRKSHQIQRYYWRHRAHQHHFYRPYAYSFIPRHHSRYGSRH